MEKQVTLSNDKAFHVSPLKLAQVRRMVTAVDAGRGMDATVQACADSTGYTIEQLEEALTIQDINELFVHVAEVSGLKMGELKVQSTSTTSIAASSPTVQ